MKLTDRQLEILEFCEKPRIANEIAVHLNLKINSIYKYMFDLSKEGYLKTKSAGKGTPHGTKLFFVNPELNHLDSLRALTFPELSSTNMDFVRAAHNPFNLWVRHG